MSQASDLERLMLDLINDERTSRGLDPVTLELRLNESAEVHSDWMLDADVFSHTGDGGSSAGERMEDAGFTFSGSWTWGENIAWQSERGAPGLEDDVANLHTALMNSPGHRANILNANFEVIGIGIEVGNYNGWNAVMVTQNFARTSADVQLDLPGPTNTAPVVNMPFVLLAPNQSQAIGSFMTFSDADQDDAVMFQIRGDDAGFTLTVNGQTVTPGAGLQLAPSELAVLTAITQSPGQQADLEIRAHDGTEWGAWDEFSLRTPAEQVELNAVAQVFFDTIAGGDTAQPLLSGQLASQPIPTETTDYLADQFDFIAADPFILS